MTFTEPTFARAIAHVTDTALGFTITRHLGAWTITITYGAL